MLIGEVMRQAIVLPATIKILALKLTVKILSFGQWLCGSVGRVVASNTRGPLFESSHQQKFIYIEHMFTVNCVLKRQK